MGRAIETAAMNHTSTVCLRPRVIARLQHAPADESVLARWCNVPLHVMRFVVAELKAGGEIVEYGDDLALPLTPARGIEIRGYRWDLREPLLHTR